jgi:hypothetical protein
MISWTRPELPEGWTIAMGRPHGMVEVVKRPTPTSLHVIVGRDLRHVIEKIEAAAGT